MDEQQTIHAHGFSRVHLYDELFFSPYHFTFTASETKAIEQERELLRIPWPLLAQVNQTRIDGAQFFALFITIPLFAETQVSPLVQQQAKDRSVTRRQELQEYITYWRKLSEPWKKRSCKYRMSILKSYARPWPEKSAKRCSH